MTAYNRPTAYRETEVLSSPPHRLVPLLYQQLLVNLKRGALQIRKRDFEGKFASLARAGDIVAELLAALDFEKGGELAGRLASLYGFWAKEIAAAGRALDPTRLDRVAQMVESLSEAWEKASRGAGVALEAGEQAGPSTR